MSHESDKLQKELAALTAELEKLSAHRIFGIYNSTRRILFFQFLRGLAFGFGSVAGATVVVSMAAYALSQIEVIPIIGSWAAQIGAEIMEQASQEP